MTSVYQYCTLYTVQWTVCQCGLYPDISRVQYRCVRRASVSGSIRWWRPRGPKWSRRRRASRVRAASGAPASAAAPPTRTRARAPAWGREREWLSREPKRTTSRGRRPRSSGWRPTSRPLTHSHSAQTPMSMRMTVGRRDWSRKRVKRMFENKLAQVFFSLANIQRMKSTKKL